MNFCSAYYAFLTRIVLNVDKVIIKRNYLPESTIAFGSANTPLPAISPVINIAAESTVSPFVFLLGCTLVSLLILSLLCLLLGEVCNYNITNIILFCK